MTNRKPRYDANGLLQTPGGWGRNAGHPVPDETGELRALMLARLEYGVHLSVSIHNDLSFSEPKEIAQ